MRRLRLAALLLSAAAAACGPAALRRQDPAELPPQAGPGDEHVLPWARVRPGRAELRLRVRLPRPWLVHPRSPFRYRVAETKREIRFPSESRRGALLRPRFPIRIPFEAGPGRYEALLQVAFHACRGDDPSSCRGVSLQGRIPIEADPEAEKGWAEAELDPGLQ